MSASIRSARVSRLPWVVAAASLGVFVVGAVLYSMDPAFALISGSAIASMTIVGALISSGPS